MKIALASDHGGYELKNYLIEFLKKKNIAIDDLGTNTPDSVDYPDYALQVAEKVAQGQADAGLLVCGTGVGMSIAANKIQGIRAAVVSEPYSARMAKEHNNANVLCLGGRLFPGAEGEKKAEAIVSAWLNAKFEGGRHQRRLDKISDIEKKNCN